MGISSRWLPPFIKYLLTSSFFLVLPKVEVVASPVVVLNPEKTPRRETKFDDDLAGFTVLNGALVHSKTGAILNAGFDYLLESLMAGPQSIALAKTSRAERQKYLPGVRPRDFISFAMPPQHHDHAAIFLSSKFSPGYYHFMFHDLLRILPFRASIVSGKVRLFANSPLTDWQHEMMQFFGIEDIELEVVDKNRNARFSTLLTTGAVNDIDYLPRPDLVVLMQNFAKRKQVHRKSEKGILWVSRSGANYRRFVNEQNFVATLSRDLGRTIHTVRIENLSFAEKVSLFQNSSVVIGAHGAGLSHIVFMNPGGRVLEISFPGTSERVTYAWLANSSKVSYSRLDLLLAEVAIEPTSDYFLTSRLHDHILRELKGK